MVIFLCVNIGESFYIVDSDVKSIRIIFHHTIIVASFKYTEFEGRGINRLNNIRLQQNPFNPTKFSMTCLYGFFPKYHKFWFFLVILIICFMR